ncbi:hypothetical protein PLESTB_000008900 [Pleodorina starrii]|uniref:Uncharacterized protein n=1 Tax=Pleodorina starrii TaxID=330485 RepID=A0A9W6B9F8_9CHLO|nr:hypothetical protein PLESTM_000838300 [Pleodorina starrii]GLC47630.1 hypothetical protein PLESTB_000008900 [Pleodorina starrii]GLC75639.1 hypothetical protein PLESTF_001668000 [Pleodorina starrii]
MASSTNYELTDGRHVWTRHLEGVGDAATNVKAHVHDGHLLMSVKGKQIDDILLPPTAFTGDARASYQRGTLRVDMASKDPGAPAMVEKALMDPDRPHPRELPLSLTTGRGGSHGHVVANTGVPAREDPTGRGAPTPAQAEFGERNPDLFGRPGVNAIMPQANLSSSIVTEMPLVTNPGAAIESAGDKGETVVMDPTASDTRLLAPRVDQLAERLGRAELAPAGTTIIRGARDKVVEAEYEQSRGGDREPHTDQYTRKKVDYTEEKVGLATRPLEARDFYATCETTNEPYSSVKAQAQGADPGVACDMCRCAPCQCDKVAKGFPYELTPAEQKRSGKPSLHNTRKPVTGQNTHAAHDYRLSAKVRSDEHAQVDFRTREYVGGVNTEGGGSLQEMSAGERDKLAKITTGGREIDPELVRDRTRTAETGRHFLG